MFDQDGAERVSQKVSDTLVIGITATSLVLTILLGWIGTYLHLSTQSVSTELSTLSLLIESLLTAIGFLVLNYGPFPSESTLALALMFLARIFGIVFLTSTVLVAVFHIFTQRLKLFEIRLKHELTVRLSDAATARHTLVCGLTDQSQKLVVQLRTEGERAVVLEEDASPVAIRRVRQAGAWVFNGPLSDTDTLVDRGKVHFADEVFVATNDEITAVSTVMALHEIIDDQRNGIAEAGGPPLRCYLNLSPSGTRRYLHEQIGTDSRFATRLGGRDNLELYTYDEPTATAREILRQHPPDPSAETSGDSIHVLLVGWSERIRALIIQLCHLLHVGDHYDRTVTVATANPEARRRKLFEEFPCLDPTNFPEDGRQEFVASLFPDIEFVYLPEQPERLVAADSELTDLFEYEQHLTVIVDEERPLQTGYLISGIAPRIDEYSATLDMHTQFLYYGGAESNLDVKDGIATETLDATKLTPFTEFYDGITPSAVRGTRRDDLAKQVALYYFLDYDYGDDEVPESLNAEVTRRISDTYSPDDDAAALWTELKPTDITELADRHWNYLSEHYRDANRFAADHLPFKQRLATRLRDRSDTDGEAPRSEDEAADRDFAAQIAAVEHRRWCAEKLLNGWEPLEKERWTDWETDTMQQKLRARRYHRDIWPIEELNAHATTAFEKDLEQVRFLLKILNEGVPEN